MTVKIVTDTLSDISFDMAAKLGVTVIPLYVRFGEKVYKDRVDMTSEEFYRKLVNESVFPSTTQPTPHDFEQVYSSLAKETDEILVISASSKLSGTFGSAKQAKELVKGKARIEVIDSLAVATGLELVVIEVAEAAKAGASLDDAIALAKKSLSKIHWVAYFDTLKYLARGGRIGKAQGLLGSMLSVKPLLTLREGEMAPLTRVRSFNAALDYIYSMASSVPKIKRVAVEHSATPESADKCADKLSALYPKEKIIRSVISPVLGTYGGPNAMAVAILAE
ncbi:MAG TPA: DegV family protein [Dehalococcoidales bacterium]|nr:DegV family protein [Dehalococcoidales bacterium]